jgi:hypothetical protein
MRFPGAWSTCVQQQFHETAKEATSFVTALLSHRIEQMKSIDSPNNSQH